jgi:hypothetical protein
VVDGGGGLVSRSCPVPHDGGKRPVDTEIEISDLLLGPNTSDDFVVKALPDTYSLELRDIVLQMLTINRNERLL